MFQGTECGSMYKMANHIRGISGCIRIKVP